MLCWLLPAAASYHAVVAGWPGAVTCALVPPSPPFLLSLSSLPSCCCFSPSPFFPSSSLLPSCTRSPVCSCIPFLVASPVFVGRSTELIVPGGRCAAISGCPACSSGSCAAPQPCCIPVAFPSHPSCFSFSSLCLALVQRRWLTMGTPLVQAPDRLLFVILDCLSCSWALRPASVLAQPV